MIELEAQAERENIPIVDPVVGELLFILAVATKAKRVLDRKTGLRQGFTGLPKVSGQGRTAGDRQCRIQAC